MTTMQEVKSVKEGESVSDTVELKSKALLELLEGASTNASKDKSLPTLNAVLVKGAGGYLMATATDRYRLIEGKIEVESGELTPSLISLADIKRINALVKENKSGLVTLNRIGDLITVSVLEGSLTVTLLGGTFPPTADLLNAVEGEPIPVSSMAFNPALFADYSKIVGKGQAVKVYFGGEGKPMRMRLTGEAVEWRALLMPMRYQD
jgi:DNA polymerase III sliding clamp (beta) subunit (PCNA family)